MLTLLFVLPLHRLRLVAFLKIDQLLDPPLLKKSIEKVYRMSL